MVAVRLPGAHNLKSPQDWDEDIQKLLEAVQKAKQMRNASAPINRILPPELLRAIMLETQRATWEVDNGSGSNYWVSLCRVCQYWKRIAIDYHYLWRRICVDHSASEAFLDRVLNRSANAPLVVVVRNPTLWRNSPISQSADRISDLRMEFTLYAGALDMFRNGAPLLQTITFQPRSRRPVLATPHGGIGSNATSSIFAPLKRMPQLRNLVLGEWNDSFVALKDVLPSTLRELTVTVTEVPTYAELHAALAEVPNLEVLWLDTGHDDPETRLSTDTISMPNIRKLGITGTPLACTFLLNVLETPEKAKVVIRPSSSTQQGDCVLLVNTLRAKLLADFEACPSLSLQFNQSATHTRLYIWVVLREPKRRTLAGKSRAAVELVLDAHTNNTLDIFCGGFAGLLDVRSLTIRSLSPNQELRWTGFFLSFDCLVTLCFSCAHLSTSTLRWLDRRVLQHPPSILFPSITQLRFSDTMFYTAHGTDGDPDSSPQTEARKRAVSWDWLKEYLAMRAEEPGTACIIWLVLHNVTGIRKEDVYELRGSLNYVLLNGERINVEHLHSITTEDGRPVDVKNLAYSKGPAPVPGQADPQH